MLLLRLRTLLGGLAALAFLSTPSAANAAIELTILEAGSQIFHANVADGGTANTSSSNYSQITVSFTNSSDLTSASLRTAFSVKGADSLNFANAPKLDFVVKDLGPAAAGINAPPGSSAILDFTLTASTSIRLSGSSALGSNTTNASSSVLDFSNSALLGSAPSVSAVASDVHGASNGATGNIASISSTYALVQEFSSVPFTTGTVATRSFGGAVDSTLTLLPPAPVPAPGGLLLAAFALPAFGARRLLRRKAAE